jgi:glycosyltransferase involved in cell wall biosynthesis
MSRLLNVNSYHYRRGGSDVVYFEHARLMQELGLEVGFFSMKHPKNEPSPWSAGFIDELEFGNDYSLSQKLSMAGKVIFSLEARQKLIRLLDAFPADIAHLHCIYHHLSPSILPVLTDRGIPAIMTAHDLKIACPAYKMLNRGGVCERCKHGSVLNVIKHRCVRDSLGASAIVAVESGLHRHLKTYQRHLSAVVCPSRFFRQKFIEWGWDEAQLVYIPNYVDASLFRPGFEPGDYVLYFGRLAPEKGIANLIRSAAKARVPLKIAGVGPEEQALRKLAADLDSPAEFLGFQSGHALHDLVRGSRCVVLPSEWYENAPMSVLESMALGKPVIGARIGGIPELIEDEATGWLFTSGSAEELTERLLQVKALASAQLQAMGARARAAVEDRFTRAKYSGAMVALYGRFGVPIRAEQPEPVGVPA